MWEYGEAGRLLTISSVGSDDCIYCQTPLLRLPAESFEAGIKRLFVQLSICPHCGWWTVYRVHQNEYERTAGLAEGYSGSIGCLKELDLKDISAPLSEVRQYLLAKKDSAFDAHPKLFEDVVCSMFKDLGWNARVTAYSGDDGVDVILDGPDGSTIGVQVSGGLRLSRSARWPVHYSKVVIPRVSLLLHPDFARVQKGPLTSSRP